MTIIWTRCYNRLILISIVYGRIVTNQSTAQTLLPDLISFFIFSGWAFSWISSCSCLTFVLQSTQTKYSLQSEAIRSSQKFMVPRFNRLFVLLRRSRTPKYRPLNIIECWAILPIINVNYLLFLIITETLMTRYGFMNKLVALHAFYAIFL